MKPANVVLLAAPFQAIAAAGGSGRAQEPT